MSVVRQIRYIMLGDNIKTFLKGQGMTVKKLSEATGIPEPSIKNMIYGLSTNPKADTIIKIAKALQCAPQELLREEKTVYETPQSNFSLYQHIVQAIHNTAKRKNISLENQRLRRFYIEEAYNYAVANTKPNTEPTVDEAFIDWIVGKEMQS